MNTNTFIELKDILKKFKSIPPLKSVDRTYLELTGYPHFENVSSNILRFVFDTHEVHGFKELFIQAITDCIPDFENENDSYEVLSVEREFSTDLRKRIDLVVECGTFVITIENKIFHWLANDLKNYKETIEKCFKKKDNRYYIILSPRNEPVHSGFISVTYKQFFERLKAHLGNYFLGSNNTYLIFLNDFIQTIENLTRMNDFTINKETFNFFYQNDDLIEILLEEKVKMTNFLYKKRRQLADCVDITNLTGFSEKWLWKKQVIAFEFVINEKTIVLDIRIDLNRIEAELFERDGGNYETIDKLDIIKNHEYIQPSQRGYTIFSEAKAFYEIDPTIFATQIRMILEKIK